MRINLFGGPGTGKSTIAGWLFYQLKHQRVPVEIVTEYVKHWVYGGRDIKPFDQAYLFAKQQQEELRFINNGVKNIITDSPCLLPSIYARLSPYEGNKVIADDLMNMSRKYDGLFPCINVFLKRNEDVYIQEGRYQDLEGAKQVDEMLFKYCDLTKGFVAFYDDKQAILDQVLARLNVVQ